VNADDIKREAILRVARNLVSDTWFDGDSEACVGAAQFMVEALGDLLPTRRVDSVKPIYTDRERCLHVHPDGRRCTEIKEWRGVFQYVTEWTDA